MLNRKTQEEILAAFAKNMEGVKLVKALKHLEYPGGGPHIHDEANPFGIHSHFEGDIDDGAHTHTPQNPGGEHSHGEKKGMALIDGAHVHGGFYGEGYHLHDYGEVNRGQIPIEEPGQELPKTNPEQPSPE